MGSATELSPGYLGAGQFADVEEGREHAVTVL